MDLRTIMNTDGGGASKASQASQSSSTPSDSSRQQQAQQQALQQQYADFASRSSQPLQHAQHAQHASPARSSSFGPGQSPYQQQFTPAPPPLNTAVQSHPSQSPQQVSTPYGSGARDPYGTSAYNSHPQATSPYTPQQAMSAGPQHVEQQSYFAQQRTNSLQSVMTNPLGAGETFRPRDSPPSASQPPSSHQFSPSTHRSVPGTPLGPPPTISSRQSPSSARPRSSGRDSPRNNHSSPYAVHEAQGRSTKKTQSPSTSRQISPSSRHSDSAPHFPSTGVKPEPSEIASPKASRQNSTATTSDIAGTAPLRSSEDRKWNESPTAAFPSGPGSDSRGSPVATTYPQITSSPSASRSGSHPLKMEIDQEPADRTETQQPKAKRRRYNEPPIYAQRSVRTKGRCPVIPNPQPPISKHARRSGQDPWASRRQSLASTTGSTTTTTRSARTPGPAIPPASANGPPPPPPPAVAPITRRMHQEGSLGPWEPSITGFIPFEETTKQLCDFLFQHVVVRTDVAVGVAGSAAAGQGAIIEVEAKLGRLVDQDRRERLVLPVLTETVINRESRLRTSFESSMSVEQHRAMNNFLNEQVKASMAKDSSRISISYAFFFLFYIFYEVSPQELPPVIRQNLNPRHKPKVRVTTDAKTGEVLAKIVKCRVADIDVYSPRTHVDWRVSVNLEMEYDGDITNLPMVDASKGGRGERNKDRMSYRHLAYQIDLTQVATVEAPTKNDFEHELEVEVSAAEIRRQGNLAMSGDPSNQYEDLVKGFVDNIRILARAVPP
ncbi:mRNA-capping enzyme subunit beta [Penicillium rolfsii]|nr:mRNA-capping enzyme subunit beta [Penicillium rolfsii]